MKILLVRPPRIKQAVTLGEFMFCEPIGLECIYEVLKDNHEIKILDLMIEKTMLEEECKSFKPEVVGITSLCIDVNMVKSIAQKVKGLNSNIIIVVGGTQAFFNPESFFCDSIDHVMKYTTRKNLNILFDAIADLKSISSFDAVAVQKCISSFDVTATQKGIPSFDAISSEKDGGRTRKYSDSRVSLDAIVAEKDQPLIPIVIAKKDISLIDGIHSKANNFQSTNVFGRNEYIIPDRASTKKYREHYSYLGYKPCAIMQTSLGCSKNCDFCLRWRLEGSSENDIDLDCIIKQIKEIQERSIMFYDNDFLNNRDRLEKFCDLLEKNNIKKNFICYASVKSIISHPDTIKRVAKNGLKAVLVGYETFNQREMDIYKKKSTVEDSYRASTILKEIGIDCWASFMLHPDWDRCDFKSFRRFVKKLKPQITTFSPLTPFSGLPMYDKYKDRLVFEIEDYEQWSFGKVSIMPSKITLRQYYFEILKFILFVNLYMNSASYMVKRFGVLTLLRIAKGSVKLLPTYIKLMLDSSK